MGRKILLMLLIAGLIGLAFLLWWWLGNLPPPKLEFVLVLPPTPIVFPTPTPDPAREQYYRGIYDVCVYFGAKEHPTERGKKMVKVACQELLKRVIKNGWYEEETPGWE